MSAAATPDPTPAAGLRADPIVRLKTRMTEYRFVWCVCRACQHGWRDGDPELHAADCELEAVLALARLAASVQPELTNWIQAERRATRFYEEREFARATFGAYTTAYDAAFESWRVASNAEFDALAALRARVGGAGEES